MLTIARNAKKDNKLKNNLYFSLSTQRGHNYFRKTSLSEADGPVDDVEEEEEHRKSSDQDIVVIRQLMAVPIFTSMAALLGQVISL